MSGRTTYILPELRDVKVVAAKLQLAQDSAHTALATKYNNQIIQK